jgi:hypothetical protein
MVNVSAEQRQNAIAAAERNIVQLLAAYTEAEHRACQGRTEA